jgi:hypothetical protein
MHRADARPIRKRHVETGDVTSAVMAGHSPSKDGRSSERPKFRPSTSSNGAAVLYTAHFWLGCVRPDHVDARRDRTVSAGPQFALTAALIAADVFGAAPFR